MHTKTMVAGLGGDHGSHARSTYPRPRAVKKITAAVTTDVFDWSGQVNEATRGERKRDSQKRRRAHDPLIYLQELPLAWQTAALDDEQQWPTMPRE